ncbi:MAG: aminoacetone oxidase family FAD-binding enzyme, partial [Kamptonema sp. SIO4C4]|nr:aminoacetone oxidase family FAD-binding enzyme [Kamptonema sp. SIO4C4]
RVLCNHHYTLPLQINWTPTHNPETLRQHLLTVKAEHPKRKLGTSSPIPIPKRLWQQLVTFCQLDLQTPWAEVSKKGINRLVGEVTQGEFQITGKGIFKEEFVTCGGVSLKEINFKTMESRCCPGLYFAGEVLDIDGVTGGFNFQSAWTTGWLAGQALGQGNELS